MKRRSLIDVADVNREIGYKKNRLNFGLCIFNGQFGENTKIDDGSKNSERSLLIGMIYI